MKQVVIKTREGDKIAQVYHQVGELVVTTFGNFCTVTHLRTGHKIGQGFNCIENAKGFCDAIAGYSEWKRVTEPTLKALSAEEKASLGDRVRLASKFWQEKDDDMDGAC